MTSNTSSTLGARHEPSRGGRRPWVLALMALAVLGGLTLLNGQARAGLPPVGGVEPPPPSAPQHAQDCFNDYIGNVARCKAVHCHSFLLFWETCNDAALAACLEVAKTTFDACVKED